MNMGFRRLPKGYVYLSKGFRQSPKDLGQKTNNLKFGFIPVASVEVETVATTVSGCYCPSR